VQRLVDQAAIGEAGSGKRQQVREPNPFRHGFVVKRSTHRYGDAPDEPNQVSRNLVRIAARRAHDDGALAEQAGVSGVPSIALTPGERVQANIVVHSPEPRGRRRDPLLDRPDVAYDQAPPRRPFRSHSRNLRQQAYDSRHGNSQDDDVAAGDEISEPITPPAVLPHPWREVRALVEAKERDRRAITAQASNERATDLPESDDADGSADQGRWDGERSSGRAAHRG
jgi:hypothetical protein